MAAACPSWRPSTTDSASNKRGRLDSCEESYSLGALAVVCVVQPPVAHGFGTEVGRSGKEGQSDLPIREILCPLNIRVLWLTLTAMRGSDMLTSEER